MDFTCMLMYVYFLMSYKMEKYYEQIAERAFSNAATLNSNSLALMEQGNMV